MLSGNISESLFTFRELKFAAFWHVSDQGFLFRCLRLCLSCRLKDWHSEQVCFVKVLGGGGSDLERNWENVPLLSTESPGPCSNDATEGLALSALTVLLVLPPQNCLKPKSTISMIFLCVQWICQPQAEYFSYCTPKDGLLLKFCSKCSQKHCALCFSPRVLAQGNSGAPGHR